MGNEHSQADYESFALVHYDTALRNPCLLPDISIDESLQKYSGLDSNALLKAYSSELVATVPGYINNLGARLAPMTSVPNAVGLGALVISMIMEICIKSTTQKEPTYSMLQRVFGEEKASAVRDTMSEYSRRHETYMNNNQRLQEELRRLEAQLSNHLTILRNSLLRDGKMSTRGLKIWVNGASFHLQMLIHVARLDVQTGKPISDHQTAINAAISLYLQDLENLLEKYKTYKTDTTVISDRGSCTRSSCRQSGCYITNYEVNVQVCKAQVERNGNNPCGDYKLKQAYMNHIFSNYEPIKGLKSHFSNIKKNLIFLINKHDAFTLPSA